MNKKLTKVERKEEILKAAKTMFLKKGFSKTTMEDVIAKTTLSKGGVYYYYKSTKDMIFDILIEGNHYRMNKIKEYIKENNLKKEDFQDKSILAEIITEKVLDMNPLMEVYAQFLIEAMYNQELYTLYQKIVDKTREGFFSEYLDDCLSVIKDDLEFEFITNIINIFILGSNILKVNKNFKENRPIIKEMIQIALEHFKR